MQGDGSFTFGFEHCRIRHFEGRHFRDVHNALKRNHIFFFGDSLTRYSYMSLAHFLVYRRWPASYPQDEPEGLSVCSEFQFHSWSKFYPWTNQQLTTLHKKVSRETVYRHPFVGVEVCDCNRKDDNISYFANSENRFLRIVPVATNLDCNVNKSQSHCSLEGDFDNRKDDIRLSFVQWWGRIPVRVHKKLANIPRSSHFHSFAESMNKLYCNDTMKDTLIPETGTCEMRRLNNSNLPHERFDLPLFPQDSSRHCDFLAEFLPLINATHMIVNNGIWTPISVYSPSFIPSLISSSYQHLKLRERNRALHMKPFVFRETYEIIPNEFYRHQYHVNDHNVLVNLMKTTLYPEFVDVFWGWKLTQQIGGWNRTLSTDGRSDLLAWKNVVLSVDYLRKKKLISWVREHPKALNDPTIKSWKEFPANQEEAFADKYFGIRADSDLGKEIIDTKMNFKNDIRYVYEDVLHFAAYVYNEINTVLLSVVVPLFPDKKGSEVKQTS